MGQRLGDAVTPLSPWMRGWQRPSCARGHWLRPAGKSAGEELGAAPACAWGAMGLESGRGCGEGGWGCRLSPPSERRPPGHLGPFSTLSAHHGAKGLEELGIVTAQPGGDERPGGLPDPPGTGSVPPAFTQGVCQLPEQAGGTKPFSQSHQRHAVSPRGSSNAPWQGRDIPPAPLPQQPLPQHRHRAHPSRVPRCPHAHTGCPCA